ncbi:hypothetical protein AVEN_61758-1 [Araneus ventricosus]|uniref:Uncharacterized protein n=1 Tax=Araneus ventricosus TaxID=182803 RepID=A0A4Y2MFJ1_ARAVE|nr:hypothetical protein AVEN_61758-1 [Araneus ventricosus]
MLYSLSLSSAKTGSQCVVYHRNYAAIGLADGGYPKRNTNFNQFVQKVFQKGYLPEILELIQTYISDIALGKEVGVCQASGQDFTGQVHPHDKRADILSVRISNGHLLKKRLGLQSHRVGGFDNLLRHLHSYGDGNAAVDLFTLYLQCFEEQQETKEWKLLNLTQKINII